MALDALPRRRSGRYRRRLGDRSTAWRASTQPRSRPPRGARLVPIGRTGKPPDSIVDAASPPVPRTNPARGHRARGHAVARRTDDPRRRRPRPAPGRAGSASGGNVRPSTGVRAAESTVLAAGGTCSGVGVGAGGRPEGSAPPFPTWCRRGLGHDRRRLDPRRHSRPTGSSSVADPGAILRRRPTGPKRRGAPFPIGKGAPRRFGPVGRRLRMAPGSATLEEPVGRLCRRGSSRRRSWPNPRRHQVGNGGADPSGLPPAPTPTPLHVPPAARTVDSAARTPVEGRTFPPDADPARPGAGRGRRRRGSSVRRATACPRARCPRAGFVRGTGGDAASTIESGGFPVLPIGTRRAPRGGRERG